MCTLSHILLHYAWIDSQFEWRSAHCFRFLNSTVEISATGTIASGCFIPITVLSELCSTSHHLSNRRQTGVLLCKLVTAQMGRVFKYSNEVALFQLFQFISPLKQTMGF